jgi:hypothetical protein
MSEKPFILTRREKELLGKVKDEYVEKIFYYICRGEVRELTPLTCENLIERYLKMQEEAKHEHST